jgi:hypothetical protein
MLSSVLIGSLRLSSTLLDSFRLLPLRLSSALSSPQLSLAILGSLRLSYFQFELICSRRLSLALLGSLQLSSLLGSLLLFLVRIDMLSSALLGSLRFSLALLGSLLIFGSLPLYSARLYCFGIAHVLLVFVRFSQFLLGYLRLSSALLVCFSSPHFPLTPLVSPATCVSLRCWWIQLCASLLDLSRSLLHVTVAR